MVTYLQNENGQDPVPAFILVCATPRCQMCKIKCRSYVHAIGFQRQPYFLCGRKPCRSHIVKYGRFQKYQDITVELKTLPREVLADLFEEIGLKYPTSDEFDYIVEELAKKKPFRVWYNPLPGSYHAGVSAEERVTDVRRSDVQRVEPTTSGEVVGA